MPNYVSYIRVAVTHTSPNALQANDDAHNLWKRAKAAMADGVMVREIADPSVTTFTEEWDRDSL